MSALKCCRYDYVALIETRRQKRSSKTVPASAENGDQSSECAPVHDPARRPDCSSSKFEVALPRYVSSTPRTQVRKTLTHQLLASLPATGSEDLPDLLSIAWNQATVDSFDPPLSLRISHYRGVSQI